MAQTQTRPEQLADAYLRVARCNHYMVGIVDARVTDAELAEAEQRLITDQNALPEAAGARRRATYDLALDLLQHEQSRRLSAASQGTATRAELDAWQAGVADHDAACAAMAAPYDLGDLNLDAMDPDDLAEVQKGLRKMADYALAKCRAMRDRAGGRVDMALAGEAACDRLYGELPTNWRW